MLFRNPFKPKPQMPNWSIVSIGYVPADRWNADHTVLIPDYVVIQHVTGESIRLENPR